MAVLLSGDLPGRDFCEQVSVWRFPEHAVIMAFTPSEARLKPYGADPELLGQAEHGRIFSSDGELHWRRTGDTCRIVYLGEPISGPTLLKDASHHLKSLRASYREFLLWGRRTNMDMEWLEHQAPRRFVYPISTADFSRGRVAIVVEDWIDKYGIPRFSRYHHLKEVKGETGHAPG